MIDLWWVQTLERTQDLATLKSMYSSQVDHEIIESYFEMNSYNLHETSDALREMIDESDAIISEENDTNVIQIQPKIYRIQNMKNLPLLNRKIYRWI
jgi:predicted DNA-binding protein